MILTWGMNDSFFLSVMPFGEWKCFFNFEENHKSENQFKT